ncbi:Krueppel-like factor 13 isoform X5 [Hippopotamus amphibius kiboko]|uniref:Krueppel-like factor 13 isoform X5 n=1 Tax=Hippopotamus amphibius kiboko TaxID=575201 RepID=UPI00259AE320|nr:Krueppel-like factor 13 isoform X5 [Hippopotamus amphibius kiboko]
MHSPPALRRPAPCRRKGVFPAACLMLGCLQPSLLDGQPQLWRLLPAPSGHPLSISEGQDQTLGVPAGGGKWDANRIWQDVRLRTGGLRRKKRRGLGGSTCLGGMYVRFQAGCLLWSCLRQMLELAAWESSVIANYRNAEGMCVSLPEITQDNRASFPQLQFCSTCISRVHGTVGLSLLVVFVPGWPVGVELHGSAPSPAAGRTATRSSRAPTSWLGTTARTRARRSSAAPSATSASCAATT